MDKSTWYAVCPWCGGTTDWFPAKFCKCGAKLVSIEAVENETVATWRKRGDTQRRNFIKKDGRLKPDGKIKQMTMKEA